MVAAADFLMAQWAERSGIDFIGIGDSLGMTLYGHSTTLPMTVDTMIEHTKAVRRGAPNTLTITAYSATTRDNFISMLQFFLTK